MILGGIEGNLFWPSHAYITGTLKRQYFRAEPVQVMLRTIVQYMIWRIQSKIPFRYYVVLSLLWGIIACDFFYIWCGGDQTVTYLQQIVVAKNIWWWLLQTCWWHVNERSLVGFFILRSRPRCYIVPYQYLIAVLYICITHTPLPICWLLLTFGHRSDSNLDLIKLYLSRGSLKSLL